MTVPVAPIRPAKTAIIVVTYNARPYLEDLFESLRAHTRWTDAVVILVDNASTDGTLEEVERAAHGLPLITLPQGKNLGFAGGNNVGLARARELGATYSLLLNQDTVVTEGWLDRLLEVADARPDIAAAQPLLLLHDEPDRVNTAGNSIHFCGFGYCGSYRKRRDELGLDDTVRSVPFATGAALLLRMEALDRTGDFDEFLFLYHEDCDLQIRLRQAGYDCVLVPTAIVYHKYKASFSGRKYALLERNRWIVLLKDWPASRLLAAAPVLAGVELAILVFAARGGWLKEKLGTYGEIARHLPEVFAKRRAVARARSATPTDGAHLTGEMQFEGLDHPLITKVANPLLSTYWKSIRRFVETAASPPH